MILTYRYACILCLILWSAAAGPAVAKEWTDADREFAFAYGYAQAATSGECFGILNHAQRFWEVVESELGPEGDEALKFGGDLHASSAAGQDAFLADAAGGDGCAMAMSRFGCESADGLRMLQWDRDFRENATLCRAGRP